MTYEKTLYYALKQKRDDEISRIQYEFETSIRELQKNCKHTNTTRYPDVSGNNGSWTECDDCKKEF